MPAGADPFAGGVHDEIRRDKSAQSDVFFLAASARAAVVFELWIGNVQSNAPIPPS